ncbi:6-hydroxymethylpterin diphosphokinase MptE-like protein [Geomesophilobacter sediminis]|uniref:DUF115 domain-containing protein n=1 Tax=Geomesophilobacter sediminis TaxID=2798584 RepID=A0A8J7IQE1_9BACT|nr:6-hydroxymethylpterin diphosphokinase MptE-like protein [Geomesophilobacter sediminis]MBJ6724834.1 DUF115 domain-containing protein [Geomesophilobacter sediminis]
MENVENPLGVFMVNRFGDRYLYAVNRSAFNSVGSESLYQSLFGDSLFLEYQLYVVVGTDSGVFPQYLAKKGIPIGTRYLFVELPEVLATITAGGALVGLPEEIVVTTVDRWEEEAAQLQFEEYVLLDAVRLQNSVASSDAYLPDYQVISWDLGLELNKRLHMIQASINCKLFIIRQVQNVADNKIGFAQTLAGAFAGRTAIVLAGGPSLLEALPWVRENRDRVVIIAVSRISKILLAHGIVPHIVATVDPQRISFEVSRELLRFPGGSDGPLLVNSHHASQLLVSQWHGRSVYTSSLFPWKTPLNADTLLYTGPTVGNFALSIAMNLGCSEIILAGIDLCFTPQGQTHAAGSNEDKVGPDLSRVSKRIETYGGWHADTNPGYAEALRALTVQARLAQAHGHKLYNCAKSAAKVPLIDFVAIDDFVVAPAEETPAALINRMVPEPTSQNRLSHYRLVQKELSRARRSFQEILNLSREALQCADGLFGTNGRERDFRHKIRMDKIERRLDQRYAEFTLLVKQFGLKKFLRILKAPTEPADWTDEQIETATRDYYESYIEGTETLIKLMDETLDRVAARIEEDKSHPKFDLVFTQWEKDEQPGRLRILRQKHPEVDAVMSGEERDRARELENAFEMMMTEERTEQVITLEQIHDVRHTRSKAQLLFGRKKLDDLQNMAEGLAKHPDPEKARPYLNFIRGLIAELRENPTEAMDNYQPLLEEGSPLTEDALLQIASLSLNAGDVDNAILALDCLSGISPAYLPPYGDLLKAIGRFEDAFNCYNRYLGMVPDDPSAMMRLAMFCQEAGITDGARELFQRILAKDPQNSAAQRFLDELNLSAPINT